MEAATSMSPADVLAQVQGSGTIEVVQIADLQTDPLYQRDISRDLVEKIKAKWDVTAAGMIVVSRRQSGALFIVNGQHRAAAAAELGKTEIVAQVITGLNAQQESELRLLGNTARNDTPQERFRAQVAAAHPESLEIVSICKQFETQINSSPMTEHGINSVSAVESLYRIDKGKTLISTLEVIKDAFGIVGGKAASVSVLKGVAFLLTKHPGSQVARDRLVEQIKRNGLDEIDRSARGFKAAVGGPMWMNYYRALVELYNFRLPEEHKVQPRTGGWNAMDRGDRTGTWGGASVNRDGEAFARQGGENK